jgi:pimeloyl-ACP methyl ester carboxylesterase
VIVTRSMGTDRAATLLAAGEDRVSGLVLLGPVTLTALPAVPLLVVGASLDGQSGDSGCASAYAAGENPKFRAVLLGGNHGQFTDLKHWEPLMDGTPTMTRNRQQELVESLTLAFVQRLGGEAESFPQWLTDPGTPAEVTLTSAP